MLRLFRCIWIKLSSWENISYGVKSKQVNISIPDNNVDNDDNDNDEGNDDKHEDAEDDVTIIMSTIKMYSRMIHVYTRLRNQSMDASYFRNKVHMRVTVAIFRENPPSICFVVKVYITCIICLFVCLFGV